MMRRAEHKATWPGWAEVACSLCEKKNGRGDRTRTRNPRFWRPMLYQLSYSPAHAGLSDYLDSTVAASGCQAQPQGLSCNRGIIAWYCIE